MTEKLKVPMEKLRGKVNFLTWDDITIDQFMKMTPIHESEESEDAKTIRLISLLFGITPEEIDLNKIAEYTLQLSLMEQMPAKVDKKFDTIVEIEGKKFKRVIDMNHLTGGMMIDFTVIRERNNLDEILTALYRPEGHEMDFATRKMWIRRYETVESAYPYVEYFLKRSGN